MTEARVDVRLLRPGDDAVLERVAPEVFDGAVDSKLTREFLNDPRHHLVVAVAREEVVGFASGVHYVHPDKHAQLFVNEVGVAPAYQRRGLARRLLAVLLQRGAEIGCVEAWVGTQVHNDAARALYAAVGGRQDPEPFVSFVFALAPEGAPLSS
jgi:aminoglycoside 6'-N-acetyltransferase I